MEFKTKITKLHYDKNAGGILLKFLEFCSLFYAVGSRLKNILYDRKILAPKKVNAYVISVGNITTGGVGKTPVVAEIANYLINQGEKVAIVSRGYGGKLSNKQVNVISDGQKIYYKALLSGDEPYWLAENTKAVVITCKSRFAGAQYAISNYGVSHIILDDGFQHRKLHRNLDIVLVDSVKGFGNEKLLPAGPLREGTEAFKRIDRLVIVSKDTNHLRAEKYARIMEKRLKCAAFVCKAEPDIVYNIKNNNILPKNSSITALSAIGQPEQFFAFLNEYNVTDKITFDDHHQYVEDDIKNIQGNIVVTEKDAVKLAAFDYDNIYALKLKATVDVEGLLNGKKI